MAFNIQISVKALLLHRRCRRRRLLAIEQDSLEYSNVVVISILSSSSLKFRLIPIFSRSYAVEKYQTTSTIKKRVALSHFKLKAKNKQAAKYIQKNYESWRSLEMHWSAHELTFLEHEESERKLKIERKFQWTRIPLHSMKDVNKKKQEMKPVWTERGFNCVLCWRKRETRKKRRKSQRINYEMRSFLPCLTFFSVCFFFIKQLSYLFLLILRQLNICSLFMLLFC